MRKRLMNAGLAMALAGLPGVASADLRFVVHVEAKKVPAVQAADANAQRMADAFVHAVLPQGAADTTYWVSDKQTRAELQKQTGNMPAGTVLLRRSDGSVLMLAPPQKLYVVLHGPQPMPPPAPPSSSIPITHTGEYATIAGVRAERLTAKIIPPARAGAPPATPVNVELWVSNQYPKYAALASQNDAILTLLGVSAFMQQGLVLRTVITGYGFADYQLESVVTELKEEPAPAGTFDVPAGFTEAQPKPAAPQPNGK